MEGAARFEELLGRPFKSEYVDEPRLGDHICYISDLSRIRTDYPEWDISISLEETMEQIARMPVTA